jgi:hypothetical protein
MEEDKTTEYKMIRVDGDLHALLSQLAESEGRTIVGQLRRMVQRELGRQSLTVAQVAALNPPCESEK